MARNFFSAIACLGALVTSIPVQAQDPAPPEQPATNEQICLVRDYSDVPQVPPEKRGKTYAVPAIARAAAMLEKKGFRQVECSSTEMADSFRLRAWRDEVCELASLGNEAVQNQLERALGERPAVLCAMAEQLSGPWDQNQRKKIRITR